VLLISRTFQALGGAAAGPVIAGLVTDSLGWRFIFAANILLVVPALVLALRLPRDRPASLDGGFDL
jgi:MFS family permease